MIAEEKKDLIDRRKFYQLMVERMNYQYNGATLNSALMMSEILELFEQLPLEEVRKAEWIQVDGRKVCSWCLSKSLRDDTGKIILTNYCSRCGSQMKMEENSENSESKN